MKIAVTGSNGSVGRRVVVNALKQGHIVLGIDNSPPAIDEAFSTDPNFTFVQLDLRDFDDTLKVLKGYEGVAHLAAYPNPTDYMVKSHNANVVISYNVLRACAELGINRVAQASTVNVITLVYSQGPHFEYFPIDEDHPCLPDEPYGLSKVISEFQADSIVRRFPSMRIASLRLHWSIPTRAKALSLDPARQRYDLWGWVQEDSGAEAFLLAITQDNGKWHGHERFIIAAPDIASLDFDTKELREKYWADVRVREGKDVSGRKGFFDCEKAGRLLGWVHKDVDQQ